MPWIADALEKSAYFMPHGHCFLWIPWLLALHVGSDVLIGTAYVGIALILWALVRRIRLPFSPVFIAFALFIGLCGATHFMAIWNVWNADYIAAGFLKAATAVASVATAIGLVYVRPQVEAVVHAARLSEERRIRLETTNAELERLVERVQQLDAMRTRFFANVSHELRTPLTLILGPAETLRTAPGLDADARGQAAIIGRNARMLLRQVDDLLDLAKLESGRMGRHYARIDPGAWFASLCAQFELAARERGLALEVDAPAGAEAELDVHKTERIAVNLLSNALKFTPPGGRVRAGLTRQDDRIVIRVADTGPGIPAGQQAAVFERFQQVEGGASQARPGTGLGLAIVREFAQLLGGDVALDSSPAGSTFRVDLPARAPQGAAVDADAPQPTETARWASAQLDAGTPADGEAPAVTGGGEATVLVVEDNPELRAFVAATLAPHYRVVTAADGHAGLAQAQAVRPDLVLTDLMMPGMGGDGLLAALRASPELAEVPVLLLSAHADEGMRVRLLAAGAQDYLTKPFLPAELLARVGNLVRAKRAADTLRAELATVGGDLEALARELAGRSRELQAALDLANVARARAEQATLVKSQFLGMVSHELRTPLATLRMNLQLLDRDPDGLPPSARERLGRMHRATEQMLALVEGLLEYTRLQSGRLTLQAEPVDVHALAREVVADHAALVPAGVEVTALPPDAPCHAVTDVRLLRILLANLVGNALKYTREGRVTVRTRRQDGHLLLAVDDTGIGIAEADIARIFEPFEQLEPFSRKSTPGMGLGLSLVREIALALGGEVNVRSQPGAGSTFEVAIPADALAGGAA